MVSVGGYIRIIFIDGDTIFSKIIKYATGSQWSHVGILVFDGLVEAVVPRVTISSALRYKNCTVEVIDFYVPDITSAHKELKNLIGYPYGFLDCISGGLSYLFGIQLSITERKTIDCCELVVRSIRKGGGIVESEIPADCFTPQSLYRSLKLSVI